MVENLNTNEFVGPELSQDSASRHVTPTEAPATTSGFDGNKPSMGWMEFIMFRFTRVL